MPFSEAERENAPHFPRSQDQNSSKAAETLLTFKQFSLMQKVLDKLPQEAHKGPVGSVSSAELLPAYELPTDRRHTSPWGPSKNSVSQAELGSKPAKNADSKGGDKPSKHADAKITEKSNKNGEDAKLADKSKSGIDANHAEKSKINTDLKLAERSNSAADSKLANKPKSAPDAKLAEKPKPFPDLTLEQSTPIVAPGKDIAGRAAAEAGQSALPTLSFDGKKINDAASVVLGDLQQWLNQIAANTIDEDHKPEAKTTDSKSEAAKTDKLPKPTVQAFVEGFNGASWKKEGSQWNFYDKLGQKIDRYDGKTADLSSDGLGNVQIKLSDGRTITEKNDGSILEYDSNNHLKTLSYADGTFRKFQWEANELVGMISPKGEYTRSRDSEGKLKNEWIQKGQSVGWQGELKIDEKSGEFVVGPTHYRSDLSIERVKDDGSREITQANKDLVKISKDGLISEINYADGSTRKFSWSENPNAKGTDDKYMLTGLQVSNKGNYYYHSRQADGKWTSRTWENGKWSDAQAEKLSFNLDNKTGNYTYTDSASNLSHIRQPGGIEKDISKDGATLEYKDGSLVKARLQDKTREFEWQDKKLVAIRDGIQGKIWKPAADGGWESDKGDKRSGNASISKSGEIEFKSGDKSTIIKLNGAEYNRVVNEKEGSQVDISNDELQVKAGDGSLRSFKTGPDGKELIKESLTRDGKTESWTRGYQRANFNYIWVNDQDPSKTEERAAVTQQDGKLNIQYADGRKYQANTSGVERLENSKDGWYTEFRDGRPAESKYPDGSIRKFTFDGPGNSPKSIEITSADGSKTNVDKISKGVYNYKKGSSELKWNVDCQVFRDGTYKYVDNDEKGNITTHLVDGLTITENPTEKSRIEQYSDTITKVVRDGNEVAIKLDKNKAPIELHDTASNSTYKKNENAEWIASAIDDSKPFNQLDGLPRKGDLILSADGTANFITADGTQIRQRPGEAGKLVSSKEKTLEACLQNESLTDAQKERLRSNIMVFSARTDIAPKDKAIFQEDLAKLASRKDISDKEKTDTYEQLGRLLESKSDKVFNAADRAKLAEQLVWHIANPESNAQGQNPNCQVTVIRGRLLYESPSQFSRMLTDVITTGEFVSKDGTTIKVPTSSLKIGKGSEESTFPPADGDRTWLGRISDVTCANIHWQRQTSAPSGESVLAGQLVFRSEPPSGRKDTGERVYKDPGNGLMYSQNDSGGKLITNPNLYANDIADTYMQIAGPQRNVILGANRNEFKAGPGVGVVNEEQLHKILSKEAGVHIAQIWTETDWVWKEPARKYGFKPNDSPDTEHVLLVKDYDPLTRTVAIDNSWSSKYDRTAADRRISLHDLYKAMAKQE